MKKLTPPKKLRKSKLLTIPVTEKEHEEIKNYCKSENVTVTSLVRFALKTTFNLNTF